MPSPPPAPEESTPAALPAASAIPARPGGNNRPPPFARQEEDDCSDSESDDETEDDDEVLTLPADPSRPFAPASSKIHTAAASAAAAAAASEGRRPVAAAMDDSRRLFQRLFTDEDEMAILEGFYQFTFSRGTTHHPHQHDTGPFYDQIRARLQLDFSKNQLVEKLRRLKKKYRTAAAKIDSGRNFAFKNPHDKAAYEVSRKIWSSTTVPPLGTGGGGGNHDDMELQNDHDLENGDRIRKRGRKRAVEPRVTEAVPVEVKAVQSLTPISMPNNASPPTPAPPPAAAVAELSPLEVPISVVEETVRSCVAPLFRDLLSSTITEQSGPWMSVTQNGMIPTSSGGCSNGSPGLEEKWRQQQILELQVFSRRLELVQEKIKQELDELRGRGR